MLALEYRTFFDTFTGNAILFTNRDETRESFVLLLRGGLLCIVSLLKYTVNCIGLCHVFICSVPFELLSLNHPRISDVTSLELTTLTLKNIFINSNITLLVIRPMKGTKWKEAQGGTVGWGTALPA
jgi:hypothetical protein